MITASHHGKIDTGRCDNTYPYLINSTNVGDTMTKTNLTQELLRELLTYDKNTGLFFWKRRDRKHFKTCRAFKIWNTRFPGKQAGSINHYGYIEIRLLGGLYKAHRLVALYITGCMPSDQVDHVKGDKLDNRWGKLRLVSSEENGRNKAISPKNKTGVPGVFWYERYCKYEASVFDKKKIHLGRYCDFFEAVCVRKSAEIKYDYHLNHGRR